MAQPRMQLVPFIGCCGAFATSYLKTAVLKRPDAVQDCIHPFLSPCLPFIDVECRDTAGQERYRSLAPMYYRGAAAAIVVYDTTSKDSFNGAKSWVKELQRRGDPNVVIALAGNKADLEGRRQVCAGCKFLMMLPASSGSSVRQY